jgi:hypothetical protein
MSIRHKIIKIIVFYSYKSWCTVAISNQWDNFVIMIPYKDPMIQHEPTQRPICRANDLRSFHGPIVILQQVYQRSIILCCRWDQSERIQMLEVLEGLGDFFC